MPFFTKYLVAYTLLLYRVQPVERAARENCSSTPRTTSRYAGALLTSPGRYQLYLCCGACLWFAVTFDFFYIHVYSCSTSMLLVYICNLLVLIFSISSKLFWELKLRKRLFSLFILRKVFWELKFFTGVFSLSVVRKVF